VGYPRRALAATSFAFSALTWLGALAVIHRLRSALAWSALAVSLVFPVWLWHELSALPGDAF